MNKFDSVVEAMQLLCQHDDLKFNIVPEKCSKQQLFFYIEYRGYIVCECIQLKEFKIKDNLLPMIQNIKLAFAPKFNMFALLDNPKYNKLLQR